MVIALVGLSVLARHPHLLCVIVGLGQMELSLDRFPHSQRFTRCRGRGPQPWLVTGWTKTARFCENVCDFVKNGLKKPQKADGFHASNWGAWERASGWEDQYPPHGGRVGSSPRHPTVARGVGPVTLAGNRPRILAPGRLRTRPQPSLARIREGPHMTPTLPPTQSTHMVGFPLSVHSSQFPQLPRAGHRSKCHIIDRFERKNVIGWRLVRGPLQRFGP